MELQLKAEYRATTGKNAARRLRMAQRVPGVLYGYNIDGSIPLSVNLGDIKKLLTTIGEETKVIELSLKRDEQEEKHQVLIKEIQVHPYKRKLLHVDFYAISTDVPIEVEVPIALVGEPVGVKKGGIVEQILHTLSIKCVPREIPERIEVDIADMDIGDVIHVKDIRDKFSFKILTEDESTIVSIVAPEDYEAQPSESEEEKEGE